MEINFFDFLRLYPNIISSEIQILNATDYINFIEKLNFDKRGKKLLVEIDSDRLTDIVIDEIKNKKETIFKKDISICIDDDMIWCVSRTIKNSFFPSNVKVEKEYRFYIYGFLDENKFYYPDIKELKNIKRSLLIEKCLK